MQRQIAPWQFVVLNAVVLVVALAAYMFAPRLPAFWTPPRVVKAPDPNEKIEKQTNAHFVAERPFPDLLPRVTALQFDTTVGETAIWGVTGRDDEGHIWFATSTHDCPELTARLYEYDPDSQTVTKQGDVLSVLREKGIWKPAEQQPKIHTKIIQAADGDLYFASMDEPRTGEVGERDPPWGSHFWRLRMPERHWEHLLTVKEGVIALAGGGNHLFGLAFPDHTLIAYDVRTGEFRRQVVGSVEGHISRNLFVDSREHVYVPRLKYTRADHAEHTLVEFDSELNEIGENPLPYYQQGAAKACHGIIAFQQLADESIVFTTHAGRLFRVVPKRGRKFELLDLGWFHPEGRAYSPSLFTGAGEQHIYGLANREWDGDQGFAWIHHDLLTGKSDQMQLILPVAHGGKTTANLLYGCQTTDNQGGFYVVGSWTTVKGLKAVVLRVGDALEKTEQ